MVKAIFKLPLRELEGFLNSFFTLMNIPLRSLTYTCISQWSKTVEVKYHFPSRGVVTQVIIDATGLKVYGEGKWKTRKHDKEKRRICRKLHLTVDVSPYEVIAAEISLISVGDNEFLPTWLNQLRLKI